MADRTVSVKLRADIAAYKAGMQQATKTTADFGKELSKAAKGGQLDHLADMAVGAGIALTAAFAGVVAITAKFDKQMSEVGAVAGATAGELDKLRAAALQAGKDTAFSATEAAKAEAELAKAGLSTSQILGGALKGSLSLAAAGSLDLAESASIAAKAMNVFQLQGSDVEHVADVLSAAANKSATDVHELGEALKMSGLAAASAGMGLEETVGTLAAFADRALAGSDGGTSLKTALQMLAAPTDKAKELMKQLGINVYDAQGQFVGTARLAGILQERLGGLTQEQRNAALATIFGADAMRAANVLYSVGEAGIRDYVAAVDDQGAAAEVAAKKLDNLAGDVEKLKGSLETLAIESGSGATGGLRTLVQAADELVEGFLDLPPAVQSGSVVLAGISGVLLLGLAAWIKSRKAMAEVITELNAMGPAGARAGVGLQAATRWAGRAATAFLALQAAGLLIDSMVSDLNPQIDALSKGLADWGRTGKTAGETARVLGSDMEDLAVGLKFLADTDNSRRTWARRLQDSLETLVPGLDQTDTSLTKTRERVQALDSALASLVQNGQAGEAREAFDRLAESVAKDGVSIDELRKLFPEYSGAVEVAGSASKDAAGGIAEVGGAAEDTKQQVEDLKAAFDDLFGKTMDLDRAMIDYRKGLLELKGAIDDNGTSLSKNTEKGLDNRDMILDRIADIEDMRAAEIAATGDVGAANKKYDDQLVSLQNLLTQMGFNKAEIQAIIDKYREIPKTVETEVSAPGAVESKKKVQDFNFVIKQTPPRKPVRIDAVTDEANRDIRATQAELAKLKDKTVRVRVVRQNELGPDDQGALHGNRWGGIYTHAATGLLSEPAIFRPASPALYAFAEPGTGGEAFIPKYGDTSRSRAIAETVVKDWLGGQVRWAGQQSAAPAQITNDNRVQVFPRQAVFTSADLAREQQRQEVRARVGRPG